MSEHPDQENANIREIEAQYDDRSDNETQAQTEAREARETEEEILRTSQRLGFEARLEAILIHGCVVLRDGLRPQAEAALARAKGGQP